MPLIQCPDCGEKYSDSYKTCPFCEEDRAFEEERALRRRSSRRGSSHNDPSILTPVLVVVIVVLALILGWLFFGDSIKERLSGSGTTPPSSSSSSQIGPGGSSSGASSSASSSGSAGSQTGGPDTSDSSLVPSGEPGTGDGEPGGATGSGGSPSGELTVEQVAALPNTLTLSKTDFTIPVGDPNVQLKVLDGGSGYTWYSEDEGIASVSESGLVTPISAGTINIYVTNGTGKGTCIVRVKGGTATTGTTTPTANGNTPPPQTTGSGGAVTLNREDFTLAVGEKFQLKSTGITTAQTWSSSNPNVATVSNDGTVTGVASGMTTVTMSYDGNSVTCIVRVK